MASSALARGCNGCPLTPLSLIHSLTFTRFRTRLLVQDSAGSYSVSDCEEEAPSHSESDYEEEASIHAPPSRGRSKQHTRKSRQISSESEGSEWGMSDADSDTDDNETTTVSPTVVVDIRSSTASGKSADTQDKKHKAEGVTKGKISPGKGALGRCFARARVCVRACV